MPNFAAWKTDNYKFVGKAFDYAYANRMNKLTPILGEVTTTSIDYELEGAGGYGELTAYDGTNLNQGKMNRGFKTIIRPEEYSKTIDIRYKQQKNDRSGECAKVGKRLGDSASMTVYLHALRALAGAFNGSLIGGDGKAWAATDHPVASLGSQGRKFTPDPDSGIFSNLMNSALSVAAITAAQTMANRMLTPDGVPFLCEMDTLLVSPELEATAKKICGDGSKLYAAEVEDINPITGLNYIVIGGGNDGFSANQWAICDRRLMKDEFNIVYNTKPQVLRSQLDNPLIDSFTAYVDFALGFGDARQIIFSQS